MSADDVVMVPIPRAALTVLEQPRCVSRLTSERVLGIPPKLFGELAREFRDAGGSVMTAKRLVLVELEPFVRWLRERGGVRKAPAPAKRSGDDVDELAGALGLRLVSGGRP